MSTSKLYLEIPFSLYAMQKIGGPLEPIEGTFKETGLQQVDLYKGKKVGFAVFEIGKPQYLHQDGLTYNLKLYEKEVPDKDEIRSKFEELENIIKEAKDLLDNLKSQTIQNIQDISTLKSTIGL